MLPRGRPRSLADECNGSTAGRHRDVPGLLDDVYAAFGKLMWLAEFNCGDGDPEDNPFASQTAADHLRYMAAVLPKLEAHPLESYSWFQTCNTPAHPGHNPWCARISQDQSEPTQLGKFYDTAITANVPR